MHPGMAANVARSARVADNTFPPDVEAEANSYYQQVQTPPACMYPSMWLGNVAGLHIGLHIS